MNLHLLLLSTFLAWTTALPAEETTPSQNFTGYLPIVLGFHGGPAYYFLSFPADGNTYYTNSDMSVNLVDGNGVDALRYCNFQTTGAKALAGMQAGVNSTTFAVGPPQPIISVNCRPTAFPGTCLPLYGQCEWCGGSTGGCFTSSCCNGYCAATRCRPF
ncbi:hypothetical protein B0J14DRAFT_609176 [Halenospora varia]|nr:hypothetical protein B0J14DRAFT_609176 [Halenospora varia]